MVKEDAVFKAIAHPARRGILGLLAVSARSVKELTGAFQMTQPAISQHLKALKEADLVVAERFGVEQRYRLTPGPLRHVLRWSEGYRSLIDPAGHVWSFVATGGVDAGKLTARRKGRHGG